MYNTKEKTWWINEILDDGTMGEETSRGSLKSSFHVSTPFQIFGKTYYYAHNLQTRHWFIQELHYGGKMGPKATNGTWTNSYPMVFSANVKNKPYIFAPCYISKRTN
ncbi:hypothetical protein Glove_606g55 [Diversispora epigaea]|nr:hypothetical protein Glove_606g55 [Diversispora epigaea]